MHFGTGLRGKMKFLLEKKFKVDKVTFDGAGIANDMYNWISENIPQNSNIIEFGAGYASTKALCRKFNLYSVEHNPKFLNIYDSNYIFAPLDPKYGWYVREKLEPLKFIVPKLVLIDGPPGTGKRFGILKNIDLIKKAEFVVVDDTDRPSERLLITLLADCLGMHQRHFETWSYLYRNNGTDLSDQKVNTTPETIPQKLQES